MSDMTARQWAEALIADEKIERTRRYLLEGRRHADDGDDELGEHWVGWVRRLVETDWEDEGAWKATVDLECEMELRGQTPPVHLVKEEVAHLGDYLQRMQRSDGVDWSALRADLATLEARMRGPKH